MKCPGQDTRYWKEDAIFEIECPYCGHLIEFFKDDLTRKCPSCKKTVPNPRMDFGCATYCKYAEICLGKLSEKMLLNKVQILEKIKQKVLRKFSNSQIKEEFLKEFSNLETLTIQKQGYLKSDLLIKILKYLDKKERESLYQELKIPENLQRKIEEDLENT